jgi:ribosomal protein S18 acetylase RimI-like enzyme
MEKLEAAKPRDLEEVWGLFSAAIASMQSKGIDQWDESYPDKERLKQDIAKGEMHLLRENGRIAATVVMNREENEEYQDGDWLWGGLRFAVLHRLCVHPDFQGKGIGEKTVRLAEAYLLRAGFEAIRLDTFPKNPQAMRLYERLGYRRAGTVHFDKGEFILFEKRLGSAEINS